MTNDEPLRLTPMPMTFPTIQTRTNQGTSHPSYNLTRGPDVPNRTGPDLAARGNLRCHTRPNPRPRMGAHIGIAALLHA